MADPRVFYDPKTREIVRTEPPGLMELIKPIGGTDLIFIPTCLFDLKRSLRAVPIQRGVEIRPIQRKP